MRKISKAAQLGAIIPAVAVAGLALSGCTTIASGVLDAPPGVNKYSFRGCLLENGFYSPHHLTGIAATDRDLRHSPPGKAPKPLPDRRYWLERTSPAFIANATKIIGDGLMPAVQYTGAIDPAGAARIKFNEPYVLMTDPGPYPGDKPLASGYDWRLNRFLDCYVAPVDDDDVEGRLLRAHILLVLLTQFGKELIVSHASSKQVTQAELLLGHVVDAEKALRDASVIMTPATHQAFGQNDAGVVNLLGADKTTQLTEADGKLFLKSGGAAYSGALGYVTVRSDDGQPVLRWKEYVTRLLRVFQVGIDDERNDAQQSLDRASNLIAAFSGPPSGFLPISKDGLAGVVSVQKTRLYGDAYLRDSRETRFVAVDALDASKTGEWTYNVSQYDAAWKRWDKELTDACTVLATIAKKDNVSCLPKPASTAQ
jgi:hypothetical protein